MIGDAYFPSYFLISMFQMIGVDCVFASDGKRAMDFRLGKRLGKMDHIDSWQKPQRPEWISKYVYDQMPDSIQVHECKATIDRPGFRSTSNLTITYFEKKNCE